MRGSVSTKQPGVLRWPPTPAVKVVAVLASLMSLLQPEHAVTVGSSALQARYLEEAAQRRALHNELVDLKGAIRVFCRVRPLLAKERTASLQAATTCNLLTNTITVTGNRSDWLYMLQDLSHCALFAACGCATAGNLLYDAKVLTLCFT